MAALVDSDHLKTVAQEERDLEYPVTLVTSQAMDKDDGITRTLDRIEEVDAVVDEVGTSLLVS